MRPGEYGRKFHRWEDVDLDTEACVRCGVIRDKLIIDGMQAYRKPRGRKWVLSRLVPWPCRRSK